MLRHTRLAICIAASMVCVAATSGCARQQPPVTVGEGEQAFAVCLACHAADSQNRPTGPNLHGLFGRRAATVEGYFYSEPLKASGIVWDATTLDTFIANPGAMVPGTFMLAAVPDPARRAAIVEYLKSLQ